MSETILGIDPGTIITGYALLKRDSGLYIPLDFGTIRPFKSDPLAERYAYIHYGIKELIEKHRPSSLAIETQYMKNNVQSLIKLGMARGVVVLTAKLYGMKVYEYAPTRVKKAVSGKGLASKHQMQSMTATLLNLKELPPEDAADALACALCHAHAIETKEMLKEY